jgi:hypothetical protein
VIIQLLEGLVGIDHTYDVYVPEPPVGVTVSVPVSPENFIADCGAMLHDGGVVSVTTAESVAVQPLAGLVTVSV